jgi:hypothetical protein
MPGSEYVDHVLPYLDIQFTSYTFQLLLNCFGDWASFLVEFVKGLTCLPS